LWARVKKLVEETKDTLAEAIAASSVHSIDGVRITDSTTSEEIGLLSKDDVSVSDSTLNIGN